MKHTVFGRTARVRLRSSTSSWSSLRRHIPPLWRLAAITILAAGIAAATASAREPAPPAHFAQTGRSPIVLTVKGATLHWTRLPGVSRYLLAIVSGHQRATYRVISGVTFTPKSRPRQTVSFRVRAYVRHARWSKLVSITYRETHATLQLTGGGAPALVSPSSASAGIALTSTSLDDPLTPSPPPSTPPTTTPPPPTTGKLKVGVMDLGNYNYAPFNSASLFSSLGVTYTREDVDRGQYTGTCVWQDYVCTALQNGIVPLVLFEGYADSNMTSEIVTLAQNLDKLAVTYPIMNKMHVIEFGNEVYWGTSGPIENATTYGRQYNAAHAALAAAGLGSWKLLAVGNGLGRCVNSYSSPDWINQVIAAQSAGAAGIDGWTVHPYGPMTTDYGCGAPGQGFGWPTVVDYHNIAVRAGSTAPWYITEVGQCLGGSGCNDPVPMGSSTDMPQGAGAAPYYTQAADIRQYLTDVGGDVRTGTPAKYPWIAALIFYQAYDDSSGWFGLLSNGSNLNQPVNYQRPALTALEQWLAANGEG